MNRYDHVLRPLLPHRHCVSLSQSSFRPHRRISDLLLVASWLGLHGGVDADVVRSGSPYDPWLRLPTQPRLWATYEKPASVIQPVARSPVGPHRRRSPRCLDVAPSGTPQHIGEIAFRARVSRLCVRRVAKKRCLRLTLVAVRRPPRYDRGPSDYDQRYPLPHLYS